MRNPYRDALAWIAALSVAVGLLMLLFGGTGDFGYTPMDEADPGEVLVALGGYAIALGALCGLLWLVVAALTHREPAPAEVPASE